ncbi:hypothetical protein RF11_14940 [Thelohanellus kitauei]|uniref:Transcription factor IIIC subunit Tfc1/Sfc1 triple barrel domain-containing protein n=1 Tax=Thelohanellus kitauei TaxID=669202 RepID=A0A0C2N360_THEKT|nr:hypothetical protein RF11_14940 [Thelohanellus kitauei]
MPKLCKFTNYLDDLDEKKRLCLNIPGYFTDPNQAIDMVGGHQAILKSVTQKTPLSFMFRPDDPFSIPVKSESVPCCGLILKIKTKKSDANPEIFVELVGIVKRTIKFCYYL